MYATAAHPLGPYVFRGAILGAGARTGGSEQWSGWTTHGSAVEWAGDWYYLHHDSSCSFGDTARRCVKVAHMSYDLSSRRTPGFEGTPERVTGGNVPRHDWTPIAPIVKGMRWLPGAGAERPSLWPPAPPSLPPSPLPPPLSPPSPPAPSPTAVRNGQTRMADDGEALNAHQGSLVYDPATARFYLYGNYHRECAARDHCHCVGVEEGWTVTTGIGIYSAPSMAGPWHKEAGPVLAPFNQPRVVGPMDPSAAAAASPTSLWRMYVQFPLRVATSSAAGGPFVLADDVVALDHEPQDVNAMLDPADGRTYIIYTSKLDHRIRVQRLTADGTAGVRGAVSAPFGPQPCEAPVLFRHSDRAYFALFGHLCWCCAQGSEAFVFRATSPLGPWATLGDANLRPDGERAVRGQAAFVLRLPPLSTLSVTASASPVPASAVDAGIRFVIAFDEWMTGSSRARMHQYWAPLEFEAAANGSALAIRPLRRYQYSWALSTRPPLGTLSPPRPPHPPSVFASAEPTFLKKELLGLSLVGFGLDPSVEVALGYSFTTALALLACWGLWLGTGSRRLWQRSIFWVTAEHVQAMAVPTEER